MPGQDAGQAVIDGVSLPRLAVAAGMPALPMVLAFLKTLPAGRLTVGLQLG